VEICEQAVCGVDGTAEFEPCDDLSISLHIVKDLVGDEQSDDVIHDLQCSGLVAHVLG
jgi:hypothetical protein